MVRKIAANDDRQTTLNRAGTNHLAVVTFENQRGIGPAETKTVRHDCVQGDIVPAFQHNGDAFRSRIQLRDVSRSTEEIFRHHQ